MKIRKRASLLAALVGAVACCAVVIGITAGPALGLTGPQKEADFRYCVSTTPLTKENLHIFVGCCKFVGGSVTVEYDANGNPTSFTCLITSNPSQSNLAVGFTNGTPVFANPGTGVAISGDASGGASHAGLYGLYRIVVTPDIIP